MSSSIVSAAFWTALAGLVFLGVIAAALALAWYALYGLFRFRDRARSGRETRLPERPWRLHYGNDSVMLEARPFYPSVKESEVSDRSFLAGWKAAVASVQPDDRGRDA